ncbi:hypothetical protein FS935_16715 [Metabacillus litoralis]|uniref:Uncharacterized protein n=1 Tax=Metabacillus litoralis TaxID=152268 RepID=A0A5C6VVT1_9BACI|nr:hypothetical protein [Metabacillus litoralis]TXC89523.1 hypothetical protein FS935_16715 [Metabacillus litoralis]
MKTIINWFIAPYQIVRSEWGYFSQIKREESTSKEEEMRIFQLQIFNILLLVVYSVFFVTFFVYIGLIFIVKWYALSGVIVGLVMMKAIKFIQENRYMKRRDAFIKNDSNLIKS